MIACLPEIPEPVRVLRECRRILRPGGLICLSELLPDPDYPLRSTERRWAAEAGLEFDEGFGNFFVYQLHFRKPAQA
jgi:ubiquinone/menaquinone biosynthesis C-methylase UbiE